MAKKEPCKYEIVAVYEGNNIMTSCAKNLKDANKIVKTKALPKMRRKEEVSDAFIEIRELGEFVHKYGKIKVMNYFESVKNWYPEDIWK